tara:strand:+ start:280 stop:1155 length:876 start_codon:yes stop_codon:yes gene_type:complete
MKILWMTSLRPLGASEENDKIQNIFLNSVLNINKKIKFSLTQFDDKGVKKYIKEKKINSFYVNIKKNKLPRGKKYSNKLMLLNALKQYLDNDFNYLVYSTADIIVPSNIFDILKNNNNLYKNKEFCALVFPNILIKNGVIKSITKPHFGIDIFIFKLKKKNINKIFDAIKYWDQYDWGINDNFYVSLCELLSLPIYNIYKKTSILKFENDFRTIKENRSWQISAWNENKNYFLTFLKKNNLSQMYAKGSYYYLLIKIFRLSDLNFKLIFIYIRFFFNLPLRIIKKFLNKIT